MLNISEPPSKQQDVSGFNHPIFELAFRSYFLMGSFTSIVALIIWLANLNGIFTFDLSGLSPTIWHAHEMIFGFAATVAVGFILTAVQTWAGRPSITKKPLAALILLWIAVRLSVWVNTETSIYLAIALQSMWWLSVIYCYANIVLKAQNRRNYLFIPILTFMGILNIALLLLDIKGESQMALHLARTGVMLFTLLMTIVGGRVIPFFTVRGANTSPIKMPPLFEYVNLVAVICSVIVYALGPNLISITVFSVIMLITGFLQLIRIVFWRTIKTISVPLLWSLHLSYLLMAIGTLLLGASQLNVGVQVSSALHLITIGAVGLMIISMMSRVSLGHTGRMLTPRPVISWAFMMIVLAAVIRVVFPYFGLMVEAWALSVILWVVAHLIFLFVYIPILTSPRVP
ncbi:NnrS family protein [Thalassotalea atypica]|uniref:NnrS family protein n=1 Tax=Thalassotalea atypica TaxID=2054316 RepID=UPI0025743289|nr:NnrS family protein [Thalassotalea atypica]